MNKGENKKGFFSRLWSFFTSIKLTVVILLCLAATSVIGTLIKQNEAPAYYISKFGTFFYNLFYILNIIDMYHSWWFRTLMAGLCINIIACSIHRLSATWKIIFPKNLKLKPNRIKSGTEPVVFELKKNPDEASDLITPIISKKFGFMQSQKNPAGLMLLAEKHRWTRLGVYVVHLSVILLVIGGLIGSFFGFEGFVSLPEGETTNRIFLRKNNQPHILPFAVRCDDFHVSFYRNGAPKEFISQLTIIEGDREILKKEIIVNDPLRYKGISFYQSSYGEMPVHNHPVADLESKTIQLQFISTESNMMYTRELAIGDSFELPEGQGTFLLKAHRSNDTFGGQDIGDTLIGEIDPPDKSPEEIQLPLRFAGFDRMRRGYFVFAVANAHALTAQNENATRRYFTGLQVSKDPGVWVVYSGFIFMIIGCYVSFFMSHQQIVVQIEPHDKHSRVQLYGTANKNKTGMTLKLKQLSETLIKKSSDR